MSDVVRRPYPLQSFVQIVKNGKHYYDEFVVDTTTRLSEVISEPIGTICRVVSYCSCGCGGITIANGDFQKTVPLHCVGIPKTIKGNKPVTKTTN